MASGGSVKRTTVRVRAFVGVFVVERAGLSMRSVEKRRPVGCQWRA